MSGLAEGLQGSDWLEIGRVGFRLGNALYSLLAAR
jgi:hypothetical protein